jgi:hypothetical protein
VLVALGIWGLLQPQEAVVGEEHTTNLEQRVHRGAVVLQVELLFRGAEEVLAGPLLDNRVGLGKPTMEPYTE